MLTYLKTSFHKAVNGYVFIHSDTFKSSLKNFEVLNIFVLEVRLKLNFLKLNTARKEHIHELTVCSA